MTLKITNSTARKLWLNVNGLHTGRIHSLPDQINAMGFVQLDTIQVVARAHHHILWTRDHSYREPMLDDLYTSRKIFEHYTHDASIIPMTVLPYWQRQFRRKAEKIEGWDWFKNMSNAKDRDAILDRIKTEGALSTSAFDSQKSSNEMWVRAPHKQALDYLWYKGVLATCHRRNFVKYYDLAHRIFPSDLETFDEPSQIDWLCNAALERLGVATAKEIAKFWDAVTISEVKKWLKTADHKMVTIQGADKSWTDAVASIDIEQRIKVSKTSRNRVHIINPFDPITRDRDRLLRLFGFDYKIEMFVPAAKRKWGYYIYPLLYNDKFIGRIEVKADRAAGTLTIYKLWSEGSIKWSDGIVKKLDIELRRLASFATVKDIIWECPKQPH